MVDKEKRLRNLLSDKSLEISKRVVKQKRKFLCNTEPEVYRRAQREANITSLNLLLYVKNTTIETANEIALFEEMKPLYVYITIYVLYEGLQITWKFLYFKIKFQNTRLSRFGNNSYQSNIYENPLVYIQEIIDNIKISEYYITYQKPLRVEIFLRGRRTDNNYPTTLENNAITVNEIKTYKTDECVICLENKNNVLFCNCGHICVCKKCIEIKRLTKCSVCKTKNTILRIIE